jgi:hypothetical protein
MVFKRLDQHAGAGELFKTTLEKALFSSPAACLETIRNRMKRLRNTQCSAEQASTEPQAVEEDIHALDQLAEQVKQVTALEFSKYQKLLKVIRSPDQGFGWTGNDTKDRLVIFTERIETLRFLREHLPRDLGLRDEQVEILYGTLSDMDQQRIVEDFGKEEASVRLLIASDVASEGINLHFLSHRMIHFDIPWSLMVFQQRNGRIDRYGQEQTPQIVYLVTQSENAKIRGDMRILELLIKKDEQAVKNIGDPSSLMGVYDIEEEEKITAQAIEQGRSAEEFDAFLDGKRTDTFDPLALIMGGDESPPNETPDLKTENMPSLFQDDFGYLQAALRYLRQKESLQMELYPDSRRVELTAPEDLRYRFRFLPAETWPEDGFFILSADVKTIQDEIKRSRKDEMTWPRIHYLWPLNPVLEWVNDKVLAAFGRHEAPVLDLPEALNRDETVFILSGLIPNRKGHPLVHRWFAVIFNNGSFQRIEDFQSLLQRTGLNSQTFPNRAMENDVGVLQKLLPDVVKHAGQWMSEQRKAFEAEINEKLNEHLKALDNLRSKQYVQLEIRFEGIQQPTTLVQGRKERERREIDRIFDEYLEWVEDTMTTEDNPYIQVIAVLRGTAD